MVDIRRLDEATVERIAAGEVVERPSSVVKELVENSLDADATRVEVTVERGGKDGVTVADDGIGMTETEVRRAVEEHTTSKIRDIDDLESGVGTLGFRGEALHAVGAVSRLTITTRPRSDRDVDSRRGTELTVEGGEVTSVEPAGCPEGTTIEVDDLFFNVPARRKYLKQDGTEFAHVNTVVTSYALANPDIAVSLTHDGRETFATTGQNDRREAVMSVYGREVAESMVEVSAGGEGGGESGDDGDAALPDGPLGGVSGLVSHPETTRSTREYLSTYVNGRYVTAGAVRDAVIEAYGHQLAPDRYPFAVLFLDVPAGDVDVNVHPRKLEVRFADEEGVREQIEAAVESALLEDGLLRSGAPRGKSAPEQAEIAPESSEPDDGAGGGPTDEPASPEGSSGTTEPADATTSAGDGEATAEAHEPDADGTVDSAAPSTTGPTFSSDPSAPSPRSTPPAETDPSTESSPEGGEVGSDADAASSPEAVTDERRATTDVIDDEAASEPVADAGPTPASSDDGGSADPTPPTDGEDRARKFAGGHDQARLGDGEPVEAAADEASAFDSLPSMRVLGQLHGTYVLAETEEGLVMVDQHAADERINYERLRERFAGETTTQALAQPVELSLTAREAELFETYGEALSTLGFRAERVGDRTVEVRTVPSLVADTADPDLLRDALAAFVEGEGSAAETVEAAADELLSDLACYPSITGNTSLTEGSVTDLLERLDDCENPWACPHGRPVVVEFDRDEIEARFERDYPGHGGRRD
ncbi:DNA mismatch repair protein mutL [Halosimplex carlsbadense 2-9-1]|uniref:DNA mismatch repair protein MutL n=1 Tax=Halosimplex carlsbadense 2-9-1 TaxID=797114 RepID=M0CW78_9EURY|nr:DNA mismatch repair endonuclease MutL [Halosimplex carlsbadense]ELZ26903.1 DNA mismatch repair protein mutL [Halosimplex carlsbadense 2-9-1]